MRRVVPALLAGALMSVFAIVSTGAAGEHVTLCHFTGDAKTPYVVIEMSPSGAYHAHHPHHADIIPPFRYRGETYSRNWDAEGRAIWANGCVPLPADGQGGGGGGGGVGAPPQIVPHAARGTPTTTG